MPPPEDDNRRSALCRKEGVVDLGDGGVSPVASLFLASFAPVGVEGIELAVSVDPVACLGEAAIEGELGWAEENLELRFDIHEPFRFKVGVAAFFSKGLLGLVGKG